ncbi:TonB-dependent receptor domain-containing protein [Pontibacter sp. MBLB2868]|uniref:TonB-dependent receptor domain-containing protein n=1 Tax=Pontibacter sp. MBLB2868 TaxID=3451555 RepID=UPI003F75646C
MTVRTLFYISLTFFLLSLPHQLWAQDQYQGYVLDSKTELPLEGVTVTANTGAQVISNANGYFTLPVTGDINSVVFSYIGYNTATVHAPTAFQQIRVLLQPAASRLQEVLVTGYESNRPLLQTAGALSLLEHESIARYDESSIVRALNTVPGVRMDERAPASYRLSIRGSTLRSPYGVRNVKVYFDGIPFTEANGTTALNLLDAANIGTIEILKGPAGSIYGAGTGGTVLLEPQRAAPAEKQIRIGTTLGSYGLRRYVASASVGAENSKTLVQYTRQQYDGYRQQSATDRSVLLLSSEFKPSEKRTLNANLIYSDLFYELPGGLTREQYQQNPRQARGGMFGSVAQNASLGLEGITMGLKQEYKFSADFRNTTALYGLHKFKDNPFNTDYERNTNQELGGRTSFVYNTSLGTVGATFTVGGEFQRGFEAARTYDNNGGTPGALRTDDEVVTKIGFVFAQAELYLPADIIATAALSLNDAQYKITRLHQASSGNYKLNRNFKTVLSPRIALLKQLTNKVSVHGSVSSGFSPPTEEEILTSDGSLNEDLEAEKGTNYELGVRGFALADKLSFDAVAYYFKLKETIVSRQDVSSVAVFRNVGSTAQSGLEVSLGYTLLSEPDKSLSLLKIWSSYAYSHFRFNEYEKGEANLSGNKLTGVAPHALTTGLDLDTPFGLYLNLTSNYLDDTPLNDENTVYASNYFVFGARAGLKRQLGKHLKLELFAGADNLTNVKYSLGNDLNAFGGRYFQPAPDRNYYGGINVGYTL